MSPFDYVKSVYNTKEYLVDNKEIFKKDYNSFIVNRALSNSELGCVLANEMNKYSALDSDIQYDFYFHGIPKQRGYLKWIKKSKGTDDEVLLKAVCSLMNVNIERALEYIELMKPEDNEYIKNMKGGK
ncbi:hypothetical protein [Synechococcus phage BUCT-ZZ01]|nr:hypothetical protein [Synechococcus phage BUCT-ZZ01]